MFLREAAILLVIATVSLHAKDTVLWSEKDSHCSHRYVGGRLFKSIRLNGLWVETSLFDDGGNYQVALLVSNGRQSSVDVLWETPAIWSTINPNSKILHPVPVSRMHGGDALRRWASQVALPDSTLEPGKQLDGFIFFPRENKKHDAVVVSFLIGGDGFEFEMSPQF